MWQYAINKEMWNVAVKFRLKYEKYEPSPEHKFVWFHIIYEVKMDFTRKVRLVADGHKVPDPLVST